MVIYWPTERVTGREPVFNVSCKLLNPSVELMDKVNELEHDTVLDIEGDMFRLDLFDDDHVFDHLIVRMSSCVVYKPNYRIPPDSL